MPQAARSQHPGRIHRRAATGLLAFVVLGVLWPFQAFPASTNTIAQGEQFVDLLAKGDFAGAVARYDTTMRAALPEPKLRESWQSIQAQAGQFKKRLQTRELKTGGYDIAL